MSNLIDNHSYPAHSDFAWAPIDEPKQLKNRPGAGSAGHCLN
jgi:hypothetical protein